MMSMYMIGAGKDVFIRDTYINVFITTYASSNN